MYLSQLDAQREVSRLLLEWCDSLVRLQIEQPDCERLDGGILCPACGCLHGRSHEAVTPLLCAARLTKNERYLRAAKRLFAWGKNLQCGDGGFRNDFKSEWKGVTVFAAIALHDALFEHGSLLTKEEKAEWESRLAGMGSWLFENLTESTPAYLNYYAANACAMALLGNYFSNAAYLALGKRLASHCMAHVTQNGLVFGEGRPCEAFTPKGCRPIDIGYNVEETLPSLCRYAAAVGDRQMLERCKELWRAHLFWMLPDGGWDNSTGTRAFKWTYWGSRTADGCQAALFELGKEDPVFAEGAWRNFELYRRCTRDGLLYGGPDLFRNGEPACVHHTFCHAKVLANALDSGLPSFRRVSLPADTPAPVRYDRELDTCRLSCGKWRLDICGSDFVYSGALHATGGSMTLLWNETAGALVTAGMTDQTLREPHNQQLSLHPETWRSGCPRIELCGDRYYAQHFCKDARLTMLTELGTPAVRADSFLCDHSGKALEPGGACSLEYVLAEDSLSVTGCVEPGLADRVCYVLPLNGELAEVVILQGDFLCPPEAMFNLCPGFLGKEYRIRPDKAGIFSLKIRLREKN